MGGTGNDVVLRNSTVAGSVYVDANDNGVRDVGETGLAGVQVQLAADNRLRPRIEIRNDAEDERPVVRFAHPPDRISILHQQGFILTAGGVHPVNLHRVSGQFGHIAIEAVDHRLQWDDLFVVTGRPSEDGEKVPHCGGKKPRLAVGAQLLAGFV